MKKNNNLVGLMLTLAVISLFISWLLLMPAVKTSRAEANQLKKEVASAQEKLASFETTNSSIASIKDIIDKMAIAIPEESDFPSIMVSLEAIGAKEGMPIANFQPVAAEASASGAFPQVSYSFSTSGDFPHIAAFIKDMETNLRITKIDSIGIAGNGGPTMNLSVSASSFSRTKAEGGTSE